MIYVVEILICILATTIGAICGVGGGVIMKPVLDASHILPVEEVSFLSGCTVLAMTTVSVAKQGKKTIDAISVALAVGGAFGGILGKQFFQMIVKLCGNDRRAGWWQAWILFVFLCLTFLYMIGDDRIRTYRVKKIFPSLLIGLALGAVSAFLGIGGGPMNLMVLYFFYSMETKLAVQNSLFIIFASQLCSLLTSVGSRNVPAFSWGTLGIMVVCGLLGAWIGGRIHKCLSAKSIQVLLNIVIVLILGICLYNIWQMR